MPNYLRHVNPPHKGKNKTIRYIKFGFHLCDHCRATEDEAICMKLNRSEWQGGIDE
jgi:hypothetical protein